jgi:hypothetical protein
VGGQLGGCPGAVTGPSFVMVWPRCPQPQAKASVSHSRARGFDAGPVGQRRLEIRRLGAIVQRVSPASSRPDQVGRQVRRRPVATMAVAVSYCCHGRPAVLNLRSLGGQVCVVRVHGQVSVVRVCGCYPVRARRLLYFLAVLQARGGCLDTPAKTAAPGWHTRARPGAVARGAERVVAHVGVAQTPLFGRLCAAERELARRDTAEVTGLCWPSPAVACWFSLGAVVLAVYEPADMPLRSFHSLGAEAMSRLTMARACSSSVDYERWDLPSSVSPRRASTSQTLRQRSHTPRRARRPHLPFHQRPTTSIHLLSYTGSTRSTELAKSVSCARTGRPSAAWLPVRAYAWKTCLRPSRGAVVVRSGRASQAGYVMWAGLVRQGC